MDNGNYFANRDPNALVLSRPTATVRRVLKCNSRTGPCSEEPSIGVVGQPPEKSMGKVSARADRVGGGQMREGPKHRAKRKAAQRKSSLWSNQRRLAAARLPAIRVDPTGGDPGLVREVEALAKRYDLSQEACRDEMPLELYQMQSLVGKRLMGKFLYRSLDNGTVSMCEAQAKASRFLEALRDAPGKWLFDQLPDCYKYGSLLQYFFYIDFDGADYVVRFKALDSISTAKGRLYLPPGKHQVSMNGRMWDVAFYRHAIERIGQRLRTRDKPCFKEYMFQWTALSDRPWVYEPVELVNGQAGLRISMIIELGDTLSLWHCAYVRELLRPDPSVPPDTRISIILGYVPVHVEGRYARAITFLYPGFANTPEHRLLDSLPSSSPVRRRLVSMIREANCHPTFHDNACEVIQWFHQNGLPQVSIEGKKA